jgi:hypothetical protein
VERVLETKKLEEIRAEKSKSSPKLVHGEGFFESKMIDEAKKEGLRSGLRAKEKMKRVAPKISLTLHCS